MIEKETAVCRGCRKKLRGEPYYKGKPAYDPETGERCNVNFYGGFVCSQSCDKRASLELERTMPGHNCNQDTLSDPAMRDYNRKWNDEV
ncbi:MAG: hypothetical protein COB41_00625 [Proteobacteria bacterium]|nr:MAG: hypothetical protein COB41_00010 [Pseudomonadota bacterium]PCI45927.1 MAG: hypothetical protein COB41_00625 [Pseudomonadota bacterium]